MLTLEGKEGKEGSSQGIMLHLRPSVEAQTAVPGIPEIPSLLTPSKQLKTASKVGKPWDSWDHGSRFIRRRRSWKRGSSRRLSLD